MLTIEGVIEDVIFRNDENGWTVAKLLTEEDSITVVGTTPFIALEENVSLKGNMVYHDTYGEQFKFESMEIKAPESLEGIKNYLGSGLLPNVGPKTAEQIVKKFGEDSLDVLHYSPEKLLEVRGIGKKTLESIITAYEEQKDIRDIMIFLQQYNISANLSMKIYKEYGDETVGVIKENPYKLAEDVHGVGFLKADEIARKTGIERDNINRVKAGIKYTLFQGTLSGHCYLPAEKLVYKAKSFLGVEDELIEAGMRDKIMQGSIIMTDIKDESVIYLSRIYEAENVVCKRLLENSIRDDYELDFNVDKEIEEIEREEGITFADKQKDAIKESVKSGCLVITGGPGTGKTTTINAIISILEKMKLKVVLGAPTGRAAKRMSETSGKDASTIHRLLGFMYQKDEDDEFPDEEDNYIKADAIIIDEASMIDINLMESLLKALKKETRIILVGDIDQLPSVGPGNILRDIIASETINVVRLDEIFRQSEESMIIVNAHRINKGEAPLLNEKDKDFFFINQYNTSDILETVLELVSSRLPKYYDVDSLNDIQVLAPMKKGETGIISLNENLQRVLNPESYEKEEKIYGNKLFRVGDKVMQMRNNYEIEWRLILEGDIRGRKGKGIFNGDMGIIREIDEEGKKFIILFDEDKEVEYEFENMDDLELSYAITVHKSQGSEFPVVIMPMVWGPPMLLMRNLLYTAITRAKQLVVLVGEPKYLNMMIGNDRIKKRYSGLGTKLKMVYEMANKMDEM